MLTPTASVVDVGAGWDMSEQDTLVSKVKCDDVVFVVFLLLFSLLLNYFWKEELYFKVLLCPLFLSSLLRKPKL